MSRRKTEGEADDRYKRENEGHLTPKLSSEDRGGRSRDRSYSRGTSRSRSRKNSSSDSSLDRMSSSKATAKLGSERKPSRHQDRDDVDLRSERSRGSRYEGSEVKERQSPGFGQENTQYDRLDTFGGRREDPVKTTGNISPGDNNERPVDAKLDQRKQPSTQYDRGQGMRRPPTGAKGDRNQRDQRDQRDKRDLLDPRDKRERIQRKDSSYSRGKESNYSRGKDSARGSRGTSAPSDPRFDKIIDAKLSKKAARVLDFNQSKGKREKDWMLDYNSHRPVNYIVDKMDQPINETVSYLLLLEGLSNIPVDSIPELKEKGSKATLNYSLTIYDDKEREFIGRTYVSRPIQLSQNLKETVNKEFVFFHTTCKTENICAVIECFLEIVNIDKN